MGGWTSEAGSSKYLVTEGSLHVMELITGVSHLKYLWGDGVDFA